jgi:hypothetical protein
MSICSGNRGVSGYADPARVCADNAAREQWEVFFHHQGSVCSQLVEAAPNRSIIRGVEAPVTRPSTAMVGSSALQPACWPVWQGMRFHLGRQGVSPKARKSGCILGMLETTS